MLQLKFKNFDDCVYNLPRKIVKHPEEYLDYVVGMLGYVDDLMLNFNTSDCTYNLSFFGYKKYKVTKTINDVVDIDGFRDFCEMLKCSGQTCCMYTFESKNFSKGGNLICMTTKRHDKRMKWKSCNVHIRTVELSRELPVLLLLLNMMFSEMPNCSFTDISVFITQANVSAYNICGLTEFYDIGVEETNFEHPFGRTLMSVWKKYFTDGCKLSNYNSLRTMQELRFGTKEFPLIDLSDVKLLESEDD